MKGSLAHLHFRWRAGGSAGTGAQLGRRDESPCGRGGRVKIDIVDERVD